MPNFGPGVDQHVNPAVTPTWVFTPTPSVPASTVRIFNEGGNAVYVGGFDVTPFNGLQLLPNNRPIELVNASQTVYTCSGVSIAGTTTTITSAVAAGSTVLTNTGTFPTAMTAAGSVLVVGNTGKGQEVLVVAGAPSPATSLTVSTTTLYDHAVSVTVQTATALPAQVRVTAGVV
jgi:uncharacterized metal-binding protein